MQFQSTLVADFPHFFSDSDKNLVGHTFDFKSTSCVLAKKRPKRKPMICSAISVQIDFAKIPQWQKAYETETRCFFEYVVMSSVAKPCFVL
jgi:hypothetical protein